MFYCIDFFFSCTISNKASDLIYKDYYKILGLETSRVTIDEIKSAYRAAAKKYHPDLNVGDNLAEERIKDINEAYRVLSTPAQKRKFDRVWNSKNNVKQYQKIKGIKEDICHQMESRSEKLIHLINEIRQ